MRSLITEPTEGEEIERGEPAIRGVAWSGAAPIARVEGEQRLAVLHSVDPNTLPPDLRDEYAEALEGGPRFAT